MRLTEQGLKEGGLGVGLVQGYALGSGYKEMLAIHSLVAKYKVSTYSHGEMLSFAAPTGANVHICHLNSTSFRDMTLAVPMIHRAIEQRLTVTVEAYPYGAASTGIGAAFLAPENLSRTA